MSGDIYIAAAGALACERRLQIISNNLANANTTGFKMDRGFMKQIDPADLPSLSAQSPEDLATSRAHLFWNNFSMYTDYSNGALKRTDNDFDLALVGKGFFCVQRPDGVHYTRKGDFTLNSEGVLVTSNGWPVLGEGGQITVKSSAGPHQQAKFIVDEQGNVAVDGQQVDSLRIVDFEQTHLLSKAGDTLFKPPAAGLAEIRAEDVKVSQGCLESSNADAVKMMTEMIEVLRGYESYQKIIQSADETYARAINEVGSLTG